MKKRCFVISPIGADGSAIREHADDVFDYVIQPAMKACDIEPFRSDHLREPGKVSEQMFREILTDDLCIAVLTGHNPNVFYELAVAHAAGRPVIALIEKGEALPFDTRDMRTVRYDLKPRSLFDQVAAKEVIEHVRKLEEGGWRVAPLFGSGLSAPPPADDTAFSFARNGGEFGGPEVWLRLLEQTEKAFDIMGIHLGPWRGNKGFSELLTRKAELGCAVRVLLMHPDNPTLPEMINESLTDVDLDVTLREIDEMGRYFTRLAARGPNISVRHLRRGTMHCQTTRTDLFAVYLPYLYSRRRRYCPLWQGKEGSDLYKLVAEEFDGLWKVADAPT